MWDDNAKFTKALENLKTDVSAPCVYHGPAPMTEELFNKIEWIVGVDENNVSITTTDNPHPEYTWEKMSAEFSRLQTEYDAQEYARTREFSYPVTKEFMEAYTEKEIGGDSTKWDAYVIKYNKVRSDNPKP